MCVPISFLAVSPVKAYSNEPPPASPRFLKTILQYKHLRKSSRLPVNHTIINGKNQCQYQWKSKQTSTMLIKCHFQKESETWQQLQDQHCPTVVPKLYTLWWSLKPQTNPSFRLTIKFLHICSIFLETPLQIIKYKGISSPWIFSKLNFTPKNTGYESIPCRNLPQTQSLRKKKKKKLDERTVTASTQPKMRLPHQNRFCSNSKIEYIYSLL